ncbi:MAG: hypothetical protein KDC33_12295 [Thermoleophilia bacterium]|nr:hypothetical protein [Thermoleophilia bacterium]
MSSPPTPPDAPATRRTSPRRVAAAAAVAALLGAGVWSAAAALDTEPTQEARRQDPLPVGVGASSVPDPVLTQGMTQTASPEQSLPPLTIILDRPAPDGIGDLEPAQQIVRLRDLIESDDSARRHVELGRAQLAMADLASAETSFRAALRRAPGDPAAATGLAFADYLRGGPGRERAPRTMARLAARHPTSQLVAFNQGLLAAYAGDPATVTRAWRRTVRLNPRSPLGRVAADLLTRLAGSGG